MTSEKSPLLANSISSTTTYYSTTPNTMPDLSHLHAASPRRLPRRHLQILITSSGLLLLCLTLYLFFVPSSPEGAFTVALGRPAPAASRPLDASLVPLEAHIMSKCPDARDCLRDLILPAMQQVESLVDFRLSYIGDVSPHDDGVTCMHGPAECLGNMLLLCAAHLYPPPKTYLGFTMCLERSYKKIPERALIEDCALEHGIDFDQLNDCVSSGDGFGVAMLRESVQRSQQANVTRSCTVRLAGEVRCIRDGGKWKDCPGGSAVEDLVRDVERLAGEK